MHILFFKPSSRFALYVCIAAECVATPAINRSSATEKPRKIKTICRGDKATKLRLYTQPANVRKQARNLARASFAAVEKLFSYGAMCMHTNIRMYIYICIFSLFLCLCVLCDSIILIVK